MKKRRKLSAAEIHRRHDLERERSIAAHREFLRSDVHRAQIEVARARRELEDLDETKETKH